MKSHKNRHMFRTLVIMFFLSLVPTFTATVLAAADYPNKPVRLIIPTTPGGSSDLLGRIIATKLTEYLGQSVVLDFHSGGGNVIGTTLASRANPDGYTLVFIAASHTITPLIHKQLPYDAIKSFAPIAKVANTPHGLTVYSSVPATTVKELIALAKKNPGKLNFGTAGLGSSAHMGAELFKLMADINFEIVHFKGQGAQIIDMMGGHHDASFGAVSQNLPHIQSGKFKVLGTTGLKRTKVMPDVPTIAEASGVPGLEYNQWFGILAPAKTPAPIVERLSKEIQKVLNVDEIRNKLMTQGAEVDFQGPSEFGIFIESEIAKWQNVANKAKLKFGK